MDEAIWLVEERFWLGGADAYRSAMDPECIMAFPAPAGIMTGEAILKAIEAAPRWASVRMTERAESRPDLDVMVIAYRAKGRREGAPAYEAYCTSTYRHGPGGWRLIQHQQTPV